MKNSKFINNTSRRTFLGGAAASVALTSGLATPWIAQAAGNVKIGLIHPATGWAAYPAAQLRYGAQMAIADINAAGGIKSMGGAKLEALLGDSQTKPEIGAAEVEKMNEAGVHALQGCYQSAVGLAASAAAAAGSRIHSHALHRRRLSACRNPSLVLVRDAVATPVGRAGHAGPAALDLGAQGVRRRPGAAADRVRERAGPDPDRAGRAKAAKEESATQDRFTQASGADAHRRRHRRRGAGGGQYPDKEPKNRADQGAAPGLSKPDKCVGHARKTNLHLRH